MRTSALFGAKNFGFRNLWRVRMNKGVSGGQVFAICADVFYERPLLKNQYSLGQWKRNLIGLNFC